jgi:hypothetical protein
LALVQHHDSVTDAGDEVHVMVDKQHGRTARLSEPLDGFDQSMGVILAQSRGWLIKCE